MTPGGTYAVHVGDGDGLTAAAYQHLAALGGGGASFTTQVQPQDRLGRGDYRPRRGRGHRVVTEPPSAVARDRSRATRPRP